MILGKKLHVKNILFSMKFKNSIDILSNFIETFCIFVRVVDQHPMNPLRIGLGKFLFFVLLTDLSLHHTILCKAFR